MPERKRAQSVSAIRRLQQHYFRPRDGFGGRLRPRAFWAGWGGITTTFLVMGLLISLLVGWILLWVYRPSGPNVTLLTVGCIAFAVVLTFLATIQNRLRAYWRVRQAQAAYLDGMSHNLRTPLSAIRTAAQALTSQPINEQTQQRLLNAIVNETRRLGLRIDNALETGRFDVEGEDIMSTPVNLIDVVEKSLDSMRDIIEGAGGTVEHSGPKDAWVLGDPRALRLVIDNLIDNSIKYATDVPRIIVRLSQSDHDIMTEITDDGIGMSRAQQKKAFKRFWRGSELRGGTGLGLPLTRAIIRSHGGTIELSSPGENKGTTVVLSLPKIKVDAS